MKHLLIAAVISCTLMTIPAQVARASSHDWLVTSPADDGTAGTLRSELGLAASDDSIHFSGSMRGQTIVLSQGTLVLPRNVTIAGPVTAPINVTTSFSGTAVQVLAGAQVQLFALAIVRSGGQVSGGGIVNSGSLTLSSVTVSGNTANQCGGIDNEGTLALIASVVSRNTAGLGGGGLCNNGTLGLTDSSVSDNDGGTHGFGGIQSSGTLTVLRSKVVRNKGLGGHFGGFAGGGIAASGTTTLQDSEVDDNSGSYVGGLLLSGTTTFTNVLVANNSAVVANGDWNTLNVGSVENSGKLTISNSVIRDGHAARGTGVVAVTGLDNEPGGSVLISKSVLRYSGCRGAIADGGGNTEYPGTECGFRS